MGHGRTVLGVSLMPRTNLLINSFNTGEVSPLIESRSDLSKYGSACRILENRFAVG